MAINGIGPLLAADEGLNHQIVDTFGTVREADRSWTEKIWASLTRKDGSLQVDFGLGKYHNRGIIDGFGGISRGHEQWTVRGSRELRTKPEATAVGPVVYEVVEPLKVVRLRLDKNDVLEVSFDLTFTAALPPYFEDRNAFRDAIGRIASDVIRYHQVGDVSGWVSIGGERHELVPEDWFGVRDHSWGLRGDVIGAPPTDTIPGTSVGVSEGRGFMHWTPWILTRPDGTRYEIQQLIMESSGMRFIDTAYLNFADGRQQRIRNVHPEISYDPSTRFLIGGKVHLQLDSGERRVVEVEAVGDSGFFLRTSGYGSWKGHRHGSWQGKLHVDGEYIADCREPQILRNLGQLRDRPVRVRDGDAEGYGIFESIITGVWPELALDADSDYGGY